MIQPHVCPVLAFFSCKWYSDICDIGNYTGLLPEMVNTQVCIWHTMTLASMTHYIAKVVTNF